MRYRVLMTDPAATDLDAICGFIAESGSPEHAARVLDRMTDVVGTLAEFPDRGSLPRELLALGIREFRQMVVSPWRVLYRVIDRRVYIVLIADGRRDMQTLLLNRVLGAAPR